MANPVVRPSRETPAAQGSSMQFAASRIRDGIMVGRYPPGEKLWQDRLAKELDVSRIPIREALFALASEGLVTLLPNRGAIVPELSEADLEELYALGMALESMAARRAVAQLTPIDLAVMKDALDRMRTAHDDLPTWYSLNQTFHCTVVEACGWPRLIKLVDGVRRSLGRYLCIPNDTVFADNVRRWEREHLELYRACRKGDAEAVCRLIEAHWSGTHRVVKENLSIAPR